MVRLATGWALAWPAPLLILAIGCSGSIDDSGEPPLSTPGALRLTAQRLEQSRLREPHSFAIPLDDRWECLSGAKPSREDGAMVLPPGEGLHVLQAGVAVEATRYSELRVAMKVDGGERARLSWESDLEPVAAANPGVEIPIAADGAYHTYVFPLTAHRAETWAGRITRLVLTPSDTPARVALRSVELAWTPPDGPTRVTIGHRPNDSSAYAKHSFARTHEALLGTQPPWTVTVPDEAVFEVAVGMLERSWRDGAGDGVRFQVALKAPRAKKRVVVDEAVDPVTVAEHRQWRSVQVDLSALAGKEVTLTLSVDPRGTTMGDYAYWGNPLVFSQPRDNAATPIVLISCDTLRADHLSCYGYQRETTPRLDAWAGETVLFENAIAQETWTPTSHMTMLTGLYPKHHGVSPNTNLAEAAPTLAEMLAGNGYLTAGYTGHSWWLLPWRGFAHGFDVYDTPEHFRDVRETNTLVRTWLERHATGRVFLFVHNYDLHSRAEGGPYQRTYDPGDARYHTFSKGMPQPRRIERPEPGRPGFTQFLQAHNQGQLSITDSEQRYLAACYDDCVRYVDEAVFDLLQTLKGQGLYEQALIIVSSDHGEEFGEHGRYGHTQVYEECCRVPLMVKFPHGRFAGRRIPDVVQLTDLYATILDVAGCPAPNGTDGHSLVGLLEERDTPHGAAFTQRHAYQALRTRSAKLIRSVRTGDYKLYDLALDPHEQENVVATREQDFENLRKPLETFFEPPADGWHLVFSNDGTPWQGAISLTTDDRMDSVRLVRLDRIESVDFKSDGHAAEGTLQLAPAIRREELVVKTASSHARLYVSVQSETPFTVHRGGEAGEAVHLYRAVLDPADPACPPTPPQQMPHDPVPALTLWYAPPSVDRTPAKDLPEGALDALRALGYM